MNKIIIKGRIAHTPELKTTDSGKEVCKFSVAVNRRFDKEKTDFFDVVAWERTGVFINTYFIKGQEILLSGEMQRRKWEDKDGNNRYSWELIADSVEFCGSKKDNEAAKADSGDEDTNEEMSTGGDDDLPF